MNNNIKKLFTDLAELESRVCNVIVNTLISVSKEKGWKNQATVMKDSITVSNLSDGSFEITIDIDETYFTMDGEGTRMQQGLEGWLKANHIPFTGSDKQLTIKGLV